MIDFWERVVTCKHEWSRSYFVSWTCMVELCYGHEVHCTKCGVYESSCGCGCCNGQSGCSNKWWITTNRKRHVEQEAKP